MHTETPQVAATRARTTWLVILGIVIILAVALSWDSLRSSMAMSSAAASDEQDLAHAAKGATVKIVLELSAPSSDRELHGALLEKQSEKVYERTATKVTVHAEPDLKIVMGKSEDIHPAAVVHVTGKVNDDRSVAATQIVILTGYIEVK